MSKQETPDTFKQQHEALIRAFCALCGIEGEADNLLKGGPLAVNDVVFSISHNAEISPHAILIYCDFGTVEEGREAEAYRALLEANMVMYSANGPMYTVSPLTGRVVFANSYPLEALDARALRNVLARLAGMSKAWHQSQFLQNPPLRAKAVQAGTLMQRQFGHALLDSDPELDAS
ncbi:MAG: molecular chaperone Tir [Bordetella sp. SCN 67-23]|nr:CesT family type III secretion system chaperone [Burkholderiales bacterium]ODS73843.1 MAG: molecular chaperone Tir [Bordetella sp. SCN 67-23]ODU67387.1 MAG: molecular chaperone Tir [Bordetella sp. SCN 68-11]OJW92702.1 MAG: molecular chaperone Tir [Burkholderiales bacterium 67-32]